ncbi:MAG TPA: 6,7-dimethyl-8-ribityllumazine synthase [Enteractinococcus helveticum]|uniref:6,7-dimethyl-8-ribityllumazine synthase n=1 Tax=Enteractinococcus helveticum TaxID=1837282 RepID=A0A921FJN2_9MICC|nr:6,7-dimethyl-8-ribityllumazine synthase [Enteractinococcus helveticum]HJF13273.1 6,7-dimethyl-8-ribityllumazine synthase [Enteractinococcus helveticum]
MAKHGAPQLAVDATGLNVAIIAGSWHTTVMNGLVDGAKSTLESSGATYEVITVAGSFEIPLAAQVALANGYDAAVCLGVIIRGETPHFEFVSDAVTSGLTRVQLDAGKPVGFGILTVDNDAQALDRAGLADSNESKGQEAAEAALQLAVTVNQLTE